MNPEHFRKLERMYMSAVCNAQLSLRIEVSEGTARVTLPVRPELFHSAGALHGAFYFKLLDDSAFFAVNSLFDDAFALTVSANIYFFQPISSGDLTAEARIVSPSKRLFVAESELTDGSGISVARGSAMFVKSKIPLGPDLGYA